MRPLKIVLIIIIAAFWATMIFLLLLWEIFPPDNTPVDIESAMESHVRKETRVWAIFQKNERKGTYTTVIDPLPSGNIQYSSFFNFDWNGQILDASLALDIGGVEKRRQIEKIKVLFKMAKPPEKLIDGWIIGNAKGNTLDAKIHLNIIGGETKDYDYVFDKFDNSKMVELMFTPVISKKQLRYGAKWTSQQLDMFSLVLGTGVSYKTITYTIKDEPFPIMWQGKETEIFEVYITDDKEKLIGIMRVARDGEVLEQDYREPFNATLKLESIKIGDDN